MTRIWPGRGVRAQELALDVDVERVPQVARGVVRRDVEHLEVGPVVLDLRALVGHEPELLEDLGDLAHRLDARMERAAPDRPAGRGDVDGFGGEASIELRAAQRRSALRERGLDRPTDDVGDRADLGPVVRRAGRRSRAGRRVSRPFLPRTSSSMRLERRRVGARLRSTPARRRGASRDRGSGRRDPRGSLCPVRRAGNHEPSTVRDVEGSSKASRRVCDVSGQAPLASSAMRPNVPASRMARSARILRSISTWAFLRPLMNWP